MTRTRILIAVAAAALLVSLAGCYTVLRHPTGSDVTADLAHSSYGYRSCSDCHADASYYHPYYRYGSNSYRWNSYYGSPWWYEQDWWWHGDDYHGDVGEPGPEPETGVRHLWGAGGWPTKGWGFGSSTAPESGALAPPPPAAPQPQVTQPSTDQKQEPQQKPDTDDDDDSSDDDGGLWKERKKGF
jgi:hypothetical protein